MLPVGLLALVAAQAFTSTASAAAVPQAAFHAAEGHHDAAGSGSTVVRPATFSLTATDPAYVMHPPRPSEHHLSPSEVSRSATNLLLH